MPDLDDLLADLATHPPVAPTPVGEIRGRARRRARRRRALVGVAAAVVVVAVGVGVAAVATTDPGDDVVAEGVTTTTAPTTTAPATSGSLTEADAAVTLDPASGHEDGSVVEISFTEPTTGPISIAQCAREVEGAGGGSAVVAWCVNIVSGTAEDPPAYTLSRVIQTSSGVVDCAEERARCILGVRVGDQATSADDRFAPLVFRDDLPPPVEPEAVVDGDEGTLGDGDALLVTLTGVTTGDVYTVMQCRTGRPPEESDDIGEGAQCSSARSRAVTVQDGPETQVTVTAFHDIFVNTAPGGWAPGWVACEPCELRITTEDRSESIARLPLVMEPTDDPIRPALTLEPDGPHAPGAEVTVGATGLQQGSTVDITWCLVVTPQGGGSSPCHFPGEGGSVPVTVAEDGTAELDRFRLPADAVQGEDCRAVAGTCGVGIHDPGWFAYLAIAPLDLSG